MSYHKIENRLLNFAGDCNSIINQIKLRTNQEFIKDQILRSSASSALNYGEARSAESRKDFIHKCQLVLKELRENFNSLKLIYIYSDKDRKLESLLDENNQLIAIFVKTVKTSQRNL